MSFADFEKDIFNGYLSLFQNEREYDVSPRRHV